jgi:hypothetical protein
MIAGHGLQDVSSSGDGSRACSVSDAGGLRLGFQVTASSQRAGWFTHLTSEVDRFAVTLDSSGSADSRYGP